jgi:adenylate cyclase class 2
MPSNQEIEIKFRVDDLRALNRRLRNAGFHLDTKRTHELNTLYDLPGNPLKKRGDILRLRKFGEEWVLTHKGKGKAGRHKNRVENETKLSDGRKMEAILRALNFFPAFRYEKFRAEWSDGKGHVVVDETPIGNFGEIEGPSRWIDQTAKKLEISPGDYITKSYGELFLDWKKKARSSAEEMTFKKIRPSKDR